MRAVIFGCSGPDLTDAEASLFREADPWGFILFARNIESPDQVLRLTSSLRDAVNREAPILVDQEGGRVQRLTSPNWRTWLPPLEQAELGAAAMELRYRIIAAELRAVGIDVNCAPCLDVATDATHPFLRNRCLGTEPEAVARLGRAVADGLLSNGVLPVIKHMPGHGRAVVDSHTAPPLVDAPLSELSAVDFAPFKALSDLPLGMTGHMIFDALDPGVPTTLSSTMIDTLRRDIGFDGLLMTDDLAMEALSGDVTTRAQSALAAGCDLALHCNGHMDEMERLAADIGPLTEAARTRSERALALRRPLKKIDLSALDAEFAALMEGTSLG
ncbi:MAG: glycoside hydrolase family 3 protein [Pseudomonadota bacterium]